MADFVTVWGGGFGIGLALGLAAFSIGYPLQIFKQGVEQI